MGELIMFNLISLDGFFAGPQGEIDWFQTDDEFDEFAAEQTSLAAALVFGRVTYELMAGYWPSEEARRDEPVIAAKMNEVPKFVFSRTLDKVAWTNSRLVRENAAEGMAALKQRTAGEIYLFGSGELAATFTAERLFDEYRLLVNPIVLGSGKPLFKGDERLDLDLVSSRMFGNGSVLLSYALRGRDER